MFCPGKVGTSDIYCMHPFFHKDLFYLSFVFSCYVFTTGKVVSYEDSHVSNAYPVVFTIRIDLYYYVGTKHICRI